MSDKLIINTSFVRKEPKFEPKECIVEKAIPLNHASFVNLNENLLKDNYTIMRYKDMMYCSDNQYHCVLMYDKDQGDGILIEAEGSNYARYSQYIPHAKDIVEAHEQTMAMSELKKHIDNAVSEWIEQTGSRKDMCVSLADFLNNPEIENILTKYAAEAVAKRPEIASCTCGNGFIEAEKKELIETRLYCPLKIVADDHNYEYDMMDMPSYSYTSYEDKINHKIEQSFDYDEKERGFIIWSDDERLSQKIYSILPSVEVRNRDLYGVVSIKSYGELDNSEMIDATNYITGQLSDGWGESFEQHEIRAGDEDIYISFWNSGDYFLKPESEVFPEQNCAMQLGG